MAITHIVCCQLLHRTYSGKIFEGKNCKKSSALNSNTTHDLKIASWQTIGN